MNETVLLVEEEPEERRPVRALLEALGWQVLEAGSGREALERSEQHPGPIHLLLTNVLMADMSGRELAERLALLRAETAVIYMSGYTDEEIIFYGVLGPGMATLRKPVTAEALAVKVEDVLSRQPLAVGR